MIGETRKCQEHDSCPEIRSFLLRPCRRRRKEGFKYRTQDAGDWPLPSKNIIQQTYENPAAFLLKETRRSILAIITIKRIYVTYLRYLAVESVDL